MKTLPFRQRLLGTLFASVALCGISAAATADPFELMYQCEYPLIGQQPLRASITHNMPDEIDAGEATGEFSISGIGTAMGNTWTGLNIVSARTIEGVANADSHLSGPGVSLPLVVPMDIAVTDVPPAAGDFDIPFQGVTPSLTFNEQGEVVVEVGAINMDLIAKREPGCDVSDESCYVDFGAAWHPYPDRPEVFAVACTVEPDQDQVLHTFEVIGGDPSGPEISVSPAALAFGALDVGDSATESVAISNAGGENLGIDNLMIQGSGAAAFTTSNDCPSMLEPSASCEAEVTFSPVEAGEQQATLLIVSGDPESPEFHVSLSGEGVAEALPALSVEPASLDFGSVVLGHSEAMSVTLDSTGNAALDISDISADGDFLATADCIGALPAGEQCSVTVTFTPSAEGTQTGTLAILSNDPDSPQTDIALNGQGESVAFPEISLDPTALAYGHVLVGEEKVLTLTVGNSGTADLSIQGVMPEGTDGDLFTVVDAAACDADLAPGDSCELSVTFAPESAGEKTATLRIDSNDPENASATVSLTGTGDLQPVAELSADPESLAFGEVTAGDTDSLDITLENTGTAALTLELDIEGDQAEAFSRQGSCNTLAAGDTCVVTINFTPGAAGEYEAELMVASDDLPESLSIALSGQGVSSNGDGNGNGNGGSSSSSGFLGSANPALLMLLLLLTSRVVRRQ